MLCHRHLLRLSAIILAALATAPAAHAANRAIYKFTLAPGASKTITLPVGQAPVILAASVTFENNGTLTPSELVGALVNQDPKSGQVTWIGTNADGSQAAGNTLSSHQVAAFGSSDAIITATASTTTGPGTLTVTQSASQTIIAGTYFIRLSY